MLKNIIFTMDHVRLDVRTPLYDEDFSDNKLIKFKKVIMIMTYNKYKKIMVTSAIFAWYWCH